MPPHHTSTSSLQKQRSLQTGFAGLRALLGLAFTIFCPLACAQTAGTGTLAEDLTDPSGASVPDAQIRIISETRGEMRAVSSAANGSYLVAVLLPGLYEVEVVRSGFKTAHFTHVRIFVAEVATLNVRLEIGAASEQITAEAVTEQLQTKSSTLGRVTDGEQVRALPLVTRNYPQIVTRNPGVAADVTDAGAIGPGFNAPVSNGGTVMDNNFQMNGVGINDLQSSGVISGNIAIPSPDTIQGLRLRPANTTRPSDETPAPTWMSSRSQGRKTFTALYGSFSATTC